MSWKGKGHKSSERVKVRMTKAVRRQKRQQMTEDTDGGQPPI